MNLLNSFNPKPSQNRLRIEEIKINSYLTIIKRNNTHKKDHTRLAAIFEYRKSSNHQEITFNLEFQNGEHNQILTLNLKDIFDNEVKQNSVKRIAIEIEIDFR